MQSSSENKLNSTSLLDSKEKKKKPEKVIDPSQLWEIHGKYYDLTPFLDKHPGGKRMLMLAQGKDCTELFESVHLFQGKPKAMLDSFYVADKSQHEENYKWEKAKFYESLRSRVQEHFKDQALQLGLKRDFETKIGHGTPFFLFTLGIFFLLLLVTSYFAIARANLFCALLSGIMAYVLGGFGHEALHGGLLATPWKNRLLALFAMDINGISSYVYSHVHITSHHIDTNIEHVDPDIEIHYPLVREFLYQKRRWFHRYQHLYCWLIYFVSLIPANLMDILALFTQKWGNLKIPRPYFSEMVYLLFFKSLSIFYIFILPYLLHKPSTALLLNILMIGPASLLLNVNFALNHQNMLAMCQVGSHQPKLERNNFRDWGELQVMTTCDYHHGHWLTDILFLGLGYQIEHHLFPLLSYSKLPHIAPIVRQTCQEFGLPYYYYENYWQAMLAHYRFLKWMGKKESVPIVKKESTEEDGMTISLESSNIPI